MEILTPTPQHLDKEQVRLIKNSKYFSCNKKSHIFYDCSRKKKITAITKSVNQDNDCQEKD